MELFLLAVALAMDACAISIANGAKCLNIRLLEILKMSAIYGIFQAIMPTLGFFLGLSFAHFIASIDHFVAFFILVFLGGKMVVESRKIDAQCSLNLTFGTLILGAIATSIDALAVGVTFSFENANIATNAAVIGIVCFVLCVIASYLGRYLGEILESKALILGGVILIIIGFKILLTHILA